MYPSYWGLMQELFCEILWPVVLEARLDAHDIPCKSSILWMIILKPIYNPYYKNTRLQFTLNTLLWTVTRLSGCWIKFQGDTFSKTELKLFLQFLLSGCTNFLGTLSADAYNLVLHRGYRCQLIRAHMHAALNQQCSYTPFTHGILILYFTAPALHWCNSFKISWVTPV